MNLMSTDWRDTAFPWTGAGHTAHPFMLPIGLWFAEGTTCIAAAAIGWVLWRQAADRGYIFGCALTGILASVLAHQLAAYLDLPRPFTVGLSPNYLQHGLRGALPSAHASAMFTLAFAFMYRSALRSAGVGLLALALITGWARVYVGAHFPSDVLAGVLLALSLASAWALLQRSIEAAPTCRP